jgi:hypothetical protein
MYEEDIIDKYCDFWECCEFLAPSGKKVNGIKLKGHKDGAITQLFCSYALPRNRQAIAKKIQEIYVVRNDLVHNAIENLGRVDSDVKVLREVAVQLFRCRVGIPFEITPELKPFL